jgi:hypothetical protein
MCAPPRDPVREAVPRLGENGCEQPGNASPSPQNDGHALRGPVKGEVVAIPREVAVTRTSERSRASGPSAIWPPLPAAPDQLFNTLRRGRWPDHREQGRPPALGT